MKKSEKIGQTFNSERNGKITRAAKGTKVVCCGDVHQIDLPYINEYTNGLTFATESMKESPLAAYINFSEEQAVRSPLATEAIKLMKE